MAIEGMTGLNIVLDGDGAWPDLQGKVGTDGRVVLAQTSLRLFLSAGDAFKARHGDPRNPQAGGLG